MGTVDNSYCRFCAEPKSSEKLLNLLGECTEHDKVMAKLTFLNAIYIDVSSRDSLPKTVCFVCYDSLNKAYDFLERVKRAQEVLAALFAANDPNKCDIHDDDILEDLLSPYAPEEFRDVKLEINIEPEPKLPDMDVKKEPKEEKEMEEISYNNTLNVHELIDAAMCSVPFTSSMTLFNKDDSDINERDITNWSEYPWVCSFCSMEFMSLEMLRSHVKIVHDKCSAHFCVDCETPIKDDFNVFMKHVRKHRKCLRNFCYYCNSEVESLADLKIHVKQHYQKPLVPCPHCGEIFKNEELLRLHILQYASDKPKRRPRRKPGTPITIEDLTCDLCKKVYKNPNSLRDHMKLHTTDRKRDYTCERCGKTFYNKGTLTSHIMSHDKIRPHVCRICNKSFLFPNMLRRHVEMHSGVKPFSCEQCGRNFRLQYQLNAHKIVHTDAMPYICQYCNKAFRFKQILKNHERQHTGAKPYSCQNCGMEFTNWSNYNKHMKRRHNTDTAKKKITPEGVFPINPETGQIMQVVDPVGTEEWKSKIMVPCKRGKKKIIKTESLV